MKLKRKSAVWCCLIILGIFFVALQTQAQAANGTWEQKKNMPCARAYAQVAAVGGQLYVAGGLKRVLDTVPDPDEYKLTLVNRLQVYNTYSNTWTTKRNMNTPVFGGAAVELNGKLYVIGGYTDDDGTEKTGLMQIYNPGTNKWEEGTNIPLAQAADGVASSAAAVLNGKIYILDDDGAGMKKLYVFDPNEGANGTWLPPIVSDPPHGFLAGCTFQALDGKLYAVGGKTVPGGVASDQVAEFDPADNSWTTLVPGGTHDPDDRYYLASGVINGRLYAVGGYTGAAYSNRLDAFDKSTQKWAAKKDLTAPARGGLGAAVINGKLYAVGGQSDNTPGAPVVSKRLDVFTPAQVSINILAPAWGNVVGEDAGPNAGKNWMIALRLVYQAPTLADTGVTVGTSGSIPGLVVLVDTGNATTPGKNWAVSAASKFTTVAVNHVGNNQVEVLTTWLVNGADAEALGNGTDATLYAAVMDYDDAALTEVSDPDFNGYADDLQKLWLASDVAQVSFNINALDELKKK